MNWRDEQQAFWNWITRPQNLQDSSQQIDDHFLPHRALSKVDALGIYNNAYHQRLIQISSELYPVTYHTLGHDVYSRLWLDYLAQHPPRPGPMSLLGEQLPSFARQHAQFGRLPALLDIIELENLLIHLFDQADEPAWTRAQLQALTPEQWPDTRWRVKSDWALMSSQFDLEKYWSQMQLHLARPDARPGETEFAAERISDADQAHYLIRRVNHRMQFQRINPAMMLFLTGIREGQTFAMLCESLSQHFPDQEIASLSLQLLLKTIDLELLYA
ncbi:HvfC/BufC family peptide modification chaperone [Pseudohongiella spirulinae]|uniref:Putative DNA-binding domain-containing protein n=1 Tax=Pseudohongiella spirulinae TaxID=1249552 RepID=A0A0S2KGT1_9GAMM|nr:putative DNA-binding domain-containing protein [Pseudohongiella spirulinae]ALO47331.1 hypothetical protein PS2015_2699 [Pseudohongiella spirulinae]